MVTIEQLKDMADATIRNRIYPRHFDGESGPYYELTGFQSKKSAELTANILRSNGYNVRLASGSRLLKGLTALYVQRK